MKKTFTFSVDCQWLEWKQMRMPSSRPKIFLAGQKKLGPRIIMIHFFQKLLNIVYKFTINGIIDVFRSELWESSSNILCGLSPRKWC